MKTRLLFLCGSLLLLPVMAGAQETKPQTKLEPQAQAVVDQMMTAYKNLPALHEKINFQFRTMPVAPNIPGDVQSELRWQKPNKLWYRDEEVVAPGKTRQTMIVCDGKNLWRWQSATNTYTKVPAPTSLAFMTSLPRATPEFTILSTGKNPFADTNTMPPTVVTLGTPDKIGDLDVDVLEGKIQDVDAPGTFRILIGAKDHLIRDMVMEGTIKNPTTHQEFTIKATATYPLTDVSPTFTAADFIFTPPPGAKPAAAAGSKKKAGH